jgi:ankyrin repeat protein
MKEADSVAVNHLDEALLDAVIDNDANTVKVLLNQGANPNCFEDKCQIRPLHFACVYDAEDVIYWLVKAGAKIDAKTSDNYRPIDIAKQLKHNNIVEIITMLSTNLVSFY